MQNHIVHQRIYIRDKYSSDNLYNIQIIIYIYKDKDKEEKNEYLYWDNR